MCDRAVAVKLRRLRACGFLTARGTARHACCVPSVGLAGGKGDLEGCEAAGRSARTREHAAAVRYGHADEGDGERPAAAGLDVPGSRDAGFDRHADTLQRTEAPSFQ